MRRRIGINIHAKDHNGTRSKDNVFPGMTTLTDTDFPRTYKGINWNVFTHGQLITYAQGIIDKEKIPNVRKFQEKYNKIYRALYKRKLHSRLKFEKRQKNWKSMSKRTIRITAQEFVDSNNIKGPKDLRSKNPSIYMAVLRANILGKIIFKNQNPFKNMGKTKLRDYARDYVKDNGIITPTGLQTKNSSLYYYVKKRGLIDKIGLEKRTKETLFVHYSNEAIVSYAQKYVDDNSIKCETLMRKLNGRLFSELKRRGIIDKLVFKGKQNQRWKRLSNEEIIGLGQKFVEDDRIKDKEEFKEKNSPLFHVLERRKLLGKIAFTVFIMEAQKFIDNHHVFDLEQIRNIHIGVYNKVIKANILDRLKFKPELPPLKVEVDLDAMSNEALVLYAKEIIRIREISGISGFLKHGVEATKIYYRIHKRKLIGQVFGVNNPATS